MSETQDNNKALVRRLLEVETKGDLSAIDELVSSDFVDHSLMPGQEGDREGYKRSTAETSALFPHLRLTIEDQIAEGNKVLTRATFRGVHDRGEFLGLAPHRRGHAPAPVRSAATTLSIGQRGAHGTLLRASECLEGTGRALCRGEL